jgi:hypothetical protein
MLDLIHSFIGPQASKVSTTNCRTAAASRSCWDPSNLDGPSQFRHSR